MNNGSAEAVEAIGRRGRSRLRTLLPALLTTINGIERGHLLDLSLTGARIGIIDRRGCTEELRTGLSAVVQWADFEAFGKLVWVENHSRGLLCGLNFERMISPAILLKTRELEDAYAASGRERAEMLRSIREWVQGIR